MHNQQHKQQQPKRRNGNKIFHNRKRDCNIEPRPKMMRMPEAFFQITFHRISLIL